MKPRDPSFGEAQPTSRSNFVGDVKFLEERRQEAARPAETVRTIREFLQNVGAMVLSPVLHLDALGRPGA